MKLGKLLLLACIGGIVLSSCGSKKDVVYFQDVKDFETIVNTDVFVPKLKIDDIIDVHISTIDMETTKSFNLNRSISPTGGGEAMDYLIDQDGFINYPVLGKIKLAGLSIKEAKELLKSRLSDYFKNPIINIRIKNFSVTILGEVTRAGTYPVNGERITIIEALGLAGDLTIKGKRDNITVIRDLNGTKVYTRIDLTTKKSLNSPVYYLTQNDVVYVEPNKSAIASSTLDSRTTIAISIASTLISTLIVVLSR